MEPLHKLPNGVWIDSGKVSAIDPQPPRAAVGIPFVDKIRCAVVVSAGHATITLPFEDFGAASAYADELAALVNAARSNTREEPEQPLHRSGFR